MSKNQPVSKADLSSEMFETSKMTKSDPDQVRNVSLSEILGDLSLIQTTTQNKDGLEITPPQSGASRFIQGSNSSQQDDPSTSSLSRRSVSSKLTFVWDKYLEDKAFSRRLVSNVIPHLFRSQAIKVFELLDNVQFFEDLNDHFKFVQPDLFPTKEDFLKH